MQMKSANFGHQQQQAGDTDCEIEQSMLVLLCGRYRIFGHGRFTETSWATLGDEHTLGPLQIGWKGGRKLPTIQNQSFI